MQLTVIGCGNAFGSGGRFHSCYLLDTDSGRLMIDCGANAPLALKRAGIDLASIDAILISHCHGDHFGGLPFLYLSKLFIEHSEKPIEIFAPRGFQARFHTLLECSFPRISEKPHKFNYLFQELSPGQGIRWRNLDIQPHEVKHFAGSDVPSLAFAITTAQKRFAYSGDSGWCDAIIDVGRKADLYLIECSTCTPIDAAHLDYQTLAQKFDDIDAKRYLLTHMSDGMLASLEKIDKTKCLAAEDGLVVQV